ncbi:MAG: NAD(P)H-dependent flavin oxidoreductase [Stenotrophomonas sp.]
MNVSPILARADSFCRRFALQAPILLAPMAGACPPGLSAAVANAGGLGALGAVLSTPQDIGRWMDDFRALSRGPAQINLWIPDPPAQRDPTAEAASRAFLSQWGPLVDAAAGDAGVLDFDAQFEALLAARPAVASSIMGVFSEVQVRRLKEAGIAWFACATTLAEALQAQVAGADAVVAQGAEAGGHRGAFVAGSAQRQLVGLFALLPRLVDRLDVPVIAAGGIADGRGVAAALLLGASAVQVGTGFLRARESTIAGAWAGALAHSEPEDSLPTRVFTGRLGRALVNDYVRAAEATAAPAPQPYPVQRGLTAPLRAQAKAENRIDTMQAWAGQSAWMAQARPAAEIVETMWAQARALL